MKLNKNGFNLYRNNKFWMVITTGENEEKAIKDIKQYVKINNFPIEEFTYKQFKNNISENFELKKIT